MTPIVMNTAIQFSINQAFQLSSDSAASSQARLSFAVRAEPFALFPSS